MGNIEKAFEQEDAEKRDNVVQQVTEELNWQLFDMGEISQLDKRVIDTIEEIRDELGRRGEPASTDNMDREIPEEQLRKYVKTMFDVEQEKLLKNLDHAYVGEESKSFMNRYEQAKALGVDVDVDENIRVVLDIA